MKIAEIPVPAGNEKVFGLNFVANVASFNIKDAKGKNVMEVTLDDGTGQIAWSEWELKYNSNEQNPFYQVYHVGDRLQIKNGFAKAGYKGDIQLGIQKNGSVSVVPAGNVSPASVQQQAPAPVPVQHVPAPVQQAPAPAAVDVAAMFKVDEMKSLTSGVKLVGESIVAALGTIAGKLETMIAKLDSLVITTGTVGEQATQIKNALTVARMPNAEQDTELFDRIYEYVKKKQEFEGQ